MANTVQIGIYNGEYHITGSDTAYQLGFGKYILQTEGDMGIEESFEVQNNTIQVDGAIAAVGGAGVRLAGLNSTLNISSSGTIDAMTAVVVYGNNAHITNDGKLTGNVNITNSTNTDFVNNGTLHGNFVTSNANNCTIEFGANSVMTADQAMKIYSATGKTTHITNYGAVTGTEFAFSSDLGDETFVNCGILKGAVSLGAGNDLFDNRLGSVDHIIKGGLGNDVFIIDKKIAISELSGEGTDTVKSTFSMNLSTGVLAGQSLEKLTLIGTGDVNGTGNALANTILGNAHNNVLSGLGGADVLSGGKGDDVLDGGAANDKLTGGLGADIFVFRTGYGHDTVTDFGNGGDRVNLTGWNAITDFADLKAHHLSIFGDSVVIHAGSEELVLQHTTKAELHASDFVF